VVDRAGLYAAWKARHPERGSLAELCKRLKKNPSDFHKWHKRKKFKDGDHWATDLVRELRK
jgi:hypothetical protein